MKVGVMSDGITGMHVSVIKDRDLRACRLGMSRCLIS